MHVFFARLAFFLLEIEHICSQTTILLANVELVFYFPEHERAFNEITSIRQGMGILQSTVTTCYHHFSYYRCTTLYVRIHYVNVSVLIKF